MQTSESTNSTVSDGITQPGSTDEWPIGGVPEIEGAL
jgi:hypothetical protein